MCITCLVGFCMLGALIIVAWLFVKLQINAAKRLLDIE